ESSRGCPNPTDDLCSCQAHLDAALRRSGIHFQYSDPARTFAFVPNLMRQKASRTPPHAVTNSVTDWCRVFDAKTAGKALVWPPGVEGDGLGPQTRATRARARYRDHHRVQHSRRLMRPQPFSCGFWAQKGDGPIRHPTAPCV